jgi:hypothetical protein
MWQKCRQVCDFLFVYRNVLDCFYDGLMPRFLFSLKCLVYRKVVWKCYGILAIVKTIYTNVLANKKTHSCWNFLVLWVPEIASSKVVNYGKYFLLFMVLTKATQPQPI